LIKRIKLTRMVKKVAKFVGDAGARLVGRDETAIREYTGNQEHKDKRLDELNLWK